MQPRVSWMEKVGKEDPQYWERETQASYVQEQASREGLETLRYRYNQKEGLHTLQRMYGCELRRDGSKGGFCSMATKGGPSSPSTRRPSPGWLLTSRPRSPGGNGMLFQDNQGRKAYLEGTCIEWLERYLSYRNETLQSTEPPGVTVVRGKTEVEDGMETHVCRLDGFYPREIDASWTRDGEVWEEETFHGSLAPNVDGTYHYWLSIRIDPKERGRYRCHVEHWPCRSLWTWPWKVRGCREEGWALWQAGRWRERNLAPDVSRKPKMNPAAFMLGWWEKMGASGGHTSSNNEPTNSKPNLGLIIIGCVVAAVVLVGVIAGILVFFKTTGWLQSSQVSDFSSLHVISNSTGSRGTTT
ncbi:putative MHC class I antigen protein [Naja naja]|nr:putative MHC class I antigen protein [Naja naja]